MTNRFVDSSSEKGAIRKYMVQAFCQTVTDISIPWFSFLVCFKVLLGTYSRFNISTKTRKDEQHKHAYKQNQF